MPKKSTTEEFIKKANKIHGDKYDYSLVNYEYSRIKVKIICPEHGEFEQKANNHINGQGCPVCGQIKTNEKLKTNIEDFIKKSNLVHKNKYNYSKVDYKNTGTRVIIICPEHGEFEQFPVHHIKGVGCGKCNGGYQLTTKDFIERSNKIHKNKYDYSKSKYTKAKNKLIIICPEHGDFEQDAYSHMKGCGCPSCNGGSNLTYTNDNKFLYLFKDIKNNLIKIGISYNPEKRLNVISNGNNLMLLNKYENCSYLEKHLHIKYKKKQIIHDLYEDGKTEWFNLTNKDIKNIERFIKLNYIS
jgi:hypothetical protein